MADVLKNLICAQRMYICIMFVRIGAFSFSNIISRREVPTITSKEKNGSENHRSSRVLPIFVLLLPDYALSIHCSVSFVPLRSAKARSATLLLHA